MTDGIRTRGSAGDGQGSQGSQGSQGQHDRPNTPGEHALAEICREQIPFLTRYFLSRGAAYDDVQDLVQETLTTFWTRRDAVQPNKAKAFLTGIARNTLLAHNRKNHTRAAMVDARLAEITQNTHPAPDTPEDILGAADQLVKIQRLVDQLPPRMAQILRMRHLEGRTHAEIADTLGLSQESARVSNSQILARLRASLRKD